MYSEITYTDASGRPLVCPRPQYTFPPFDVSVQREGFTGVGDIVYGREELIVVDDEGRQWFSQNLMSPALLEYFLENPTRFLSVGARRRRDFDGIRQVVDDAHSRLGVTASIEIAEILTSLLEAYKVGMKYGVMGSLVVETAYDEFEKLVYRAMPSRRACSTYIASILQVPVARVAAEIGFTQDRRGTKRISDVEGPPVRIFAKTVPWTSSVHDGVVCKALWENDELARFWSLRLIVPMIVQFAEEWRYADYSLRTHLLHFIRAGCTAISCDIEDVFRRHYRDFLEALSQPVT